MQSIWFSIFTWPSHQGMPYNLTSRLIIDRYWSANAFFFFFPISELYERDSNIPSYFFSFPKRKFPLVPDMYCRTCDGWKSGLGPHCEWHSNQRDCVHSPDTHQHLNTWPYVWSYINYTELEAKGESDRLTEDQLKGIVNKKELLRITQKHCPNQAFAFWILETELEKTELEIGQDIRLKTKGDGPFICECYLGSSMH